MTMPVRMTITGQNGQEKFHSPISLPSQTIPQHKINNPSTTTPTRILCKYPILLYHQESLKTSHFITRTACPRNDYRHYTGILQSFLRNLWSPDHQNPYLSSYTSGILCLPWYQHHITLGGGLTYNSAFGSIWTRWLREVLFIYTLSFFYRINVSCSLFGKLLSYRRQIRN